MMQCQQRAVHGCDTVYGPTKENRQQRGCLKKLKRLIRFSRQDVKGHQRKQVKVS